MMPATFQCFLALVIVSFVTAQEEITCPGEYSIGEEGHCYREADVISYPNQVNASTICEEDEVPIMWDFDLVYTGAKAIDKQFVWMNTVRDPATGRFKYANAEDGDDFIKRSPDSDVYLTDTTGTMCVEMIAKDDEEPKLGLRACDNECPIICGLQMACPANMTYVLGNDGYCYRKQIKKPQAVQLEEGCEWPYEEPVFSAYDELVFSANLLGMKYLWTDGAQANDTEDRMKFCQGDCGDYIKPTPNANRYLPWKNTNSCVEYIDNGKKPQPFLAIRNCNTPCPIVCRRPELPPNMS